MANLEELYRQRDNLQQKIMDLQKKLEVCKTEIDQKSTVEVLTRGDIVTCLSVEFPMAFVKLLESSSDKASQLSNYLNQWAKAIVDQKKGQNITIEAIIPLLKKGWVAMDYNRRWSWYQKKPTKNLSRHWWHPEEGSNTACLDCFRLKRAKNWEESLRECGGDDV